jgi:hypothetical protein
MISDETESFRYVRGVSSLFFRYDEPRRPRWGSSAADQFLKNSVVEKFQNTTLPTLHEERN